MKLERLLEGIEYELLRGSLDIEISDVIYNTKMLKPDTAFICKAGANFDSHTLAQDAVNNGAIAIICEHDVEACGCTVVKVPNTAAAECLMSANLYDHPAEKMTMIGITGSKGKTTTAYLIKRVLEEAGKKVGIIGTIGVFSGEKELDSRGHTTTPAGYEIPRLLDEMYRDGCEYVVMEASSQGFKVNRMVGIMFDYGIFLNISRDHVGPAEHATLEEYLECKKQLLRQCRVGLVNYDDAKYDSIIDGHSCEKLVSFGFGEGSDIQITDLKKVEGAFLGISYRTNGALELDVTAGMPGKFTAYNSVSAAYVCHEIGVPDEIISKAMIDIKIRGRVEKVDIDAPYTVIIDFAHNGIGIKNLISAVRDYEPNRIIAVFGASGDRSKMRRIDAGEILGQDADLTIITANSPRHEKVEDINKDIKKGLDKTAGKYIEIIDRREAIEYAMSIAEEGDYILLIGKGHWDYDEVDGVMYPFDERKIVKESYEKLKGLESRDHGVKNE